MPIIGKFLFYRVTKNKTLEENQRGLYRNRYGCLFKSMHANYRIYKYILSYIQPALFALRQFS